MTIHLLVEYTEFIFAGVFGGIQRRVGSFHKRRTVCPMHRSHADADAGRHIQLVALDAVGFLNLPQNMLCRLLGILYIAIGQSDQKFVAAEPEDLAFQGDTFS
ncbi:hypothetical protein D3C75_760200 [compost metagenome]